MNARQKNAMNRANEHPENKFVFMLLANKLCQKYNNGKEFDFRKFDFNHFKNNQHPNRDEDNESGIFFETLNRIIYNIVTDELKANPEICRTHYTFYNIQTHEDIFYSLDDFEHGFGADSTLINNAFFKYFVAPIQFKLRISNSAFNYMYMEIYRNTNVLKDDYANTEDAGWGMYNCDAVVLKLSDINNGHLDPKGFCEFISHLKEFLEYVTSSGFINLMEIMKSLVWLSFFTGISPDGEKIMFLTDIHMKDRDHRNSYRKYREMKAQGWKFSKAIKMIDIIGKTNYKNYILDLQILPFFALQENLCDELPGRTKSFLDEHMANDPMMRFIDSVLSENNLTNKDGIICTSIKEFMDSTNHMSLYGRPFRYELSIDKLWNEYKNEINSEYQNITAANTVDFIKYHPVMK